MEQKCGLGICIAAQVVAHIPDLMVECTLVLAVALTQDQAVECIRARAAVHIRVLMVVYIQDQVVVLIQVLVVVATPVLVEGFTQGQVVVFIRDRVAVCTQAQIQIHLLEFSRHGLTLPKRSKKWACGEKPI